MITPNRPILHRRKLRPTEGMRLAQNHTEHVCQGLSHSAQAQTHSLGPLRSSLPASEYSWFAHGPPHISHKRLPTAAWLPPVTGSSLPVQSGPISALGSPAAGSVFPRRADICGRRQPKRLLNAEGFLLRCTNPLEAPRHLFRSDPIEWWRFLPKAGTRNCGSSRENSNTPGGSGLDLQGKTWAWDLGF